MSDSENPLLNSWNTLHGIPPFEQISTEHYQEAFDIGFVQHNEEIQMIINNPAPPDFANTVEAMERSGKTLQKVASVFFNLASSTTSDRLQEIQTEISPQYAGHYSRLYTEQGLFKRIDQVMRNNFESLNREQQQLISEYHQSFIRSGSSLDTTERDQVKALDTELATLQTQFGQNIQKDSNVFELHIENETELSGLPESVRQMGAQEANDCNKSGYIFTISRSSITPFLQYADNRELREKILNAYVRCADNNNEFDNKTVAQKIAGLRNKRATLLGYPSHAAYMLDDRMAGTTENVRDLLDQLWAPAKEKVRHEADRLQQAIQEEGSNFTLAPWDWWYYTEKVRAKDFNLDEEALKPYFSLERVRQGAFDVAEKLFGITFNKLSDFPKYHEDVEAYEVKEADGKLIGIFMTDYFMRASKRSGAWMNTFREQSALDGEVYPIVVNVCNFPKGKPALLGLDEVRTLFHEFGHGLHGLLSKVTYQSLSGTNVKQDFVELPSQIMEHWAQEPAVLKAYALHHETDEVIPDELIEKIQQSATFNQGFATTEYLAACYLDLAWHELETDQPPAVELLEAESMKAIDLVDEVHPRYRSTYYQHIFAGTSYSAGYYSYIWAEVLDADGYESFVENGIFDSATALAFRENVLQKGGSEDPMTLYRAFKGRDPDVKPLLKHRGLA